MEKHEESIFKLLPVEIKAFLIEECLKNSAKDTTSLLCTCRSFCDAKKALLWKNAYYRAFYNHDELAIDQPSHQIKYFLRYFLPSNPNASNDEWFRATLLRVKYDDTLEAINIDKTVLNSTGWRTVIDHDPYRFNYLRDLSPASYKYGFEVSFADVTDELDIKFHLCFLELTLQRFLKDPTEYPISAIDFHHFVKQINIHMAYSRILCSKYIPEASPDPVQEKPARPLHNNFNGSEPMFLNGDDIEYSIQPGREWGVFSDHAQRGLLWGREIDELLKNKYKVDISLYDPNIFAPRPDIRNLSYFR